MDVLHKTFISYKFNCISKLQCFLSSVVSHYKTFLNFHTYSSLRSHLQSWKGAPLDSSSAPAVSWTTVLTCRKISPKFTTEKNVQVYFIKEVPFYFLIYLGWSILVNFTVLTKQLSSKQRIWILYLNATQNHKSYS